MIVYQRGKNVALLGAVLQFIFAAVMLAIGISTHFIAAMTCAYFLAIGVLVWLVAALLFYCYELQRREEMELSELAAAGAQTSTIFEAGSAEMHPAALRVKFMEKWIAPGFTVVWAVILAVMGAMELRFLSTQHATADATSAPSALFAVMIAFVAFLFSRYAVGMSERVEWRLLRATGSYLTVNVILMAAISVILLADGQGYFDLVAAYVVAIIQLVLALEMLLNFVLDIYRPRVTGQEDRFSFDSRLFNLVAQPGKIGHSLAEAINYQFGFEVSKSWFYQLLGRAMLPMVIFAAIIMLAMSSILIVNQGEQYVVLHWGQPLSGGPVGPGMHFKWPWPIDTARRFETGKIHEILLGVGQPRTPEQRASAFVKGKELYLWKEDHGTMEEKPFLIAAQRNAAAGSSTSDAPSINIIMLVVRVQYRITDPVKFGMKFENGNDLLKCLANREMVKYCAAATLDSPVGDGQRPEAIMTTGRGKVAEALKERIQKACDSVDEGGMGVEIAYVGLDAVHPPKGVAPTAEKVLEAERKQDSLRYQAEAEANSILAAAAGDPERALKLALAIRQKDELSSLRDFIGDSGEFDRRLKEDLRRGQDEVSAGAALSGAAAGKGDLPKQHQQYLELLQSIQQAASAKDQAGVDSLLKPALAKASLDADTLLDAALGQSATKVADALAERWVREMAERGKAEAFANQLAAYKASPDNYVVDRYLDVWDEVLPNVTKYVLAVDRNKVQVWLDWTLQNQPLSNILDSSSQRK